jgi:pimeloyl-ACP methyl ester carboxylesterase
MYIPTDRMIKVGNVNTRYWMEGEGTPVILIHGLSNSIEDWLLNFKVLAEHHQVYALDLLGHGKTGKPLSAPYTISNLSRFVIDFMNAVEIKRAHIIGHSLGGAIALTIAIHHPAYLNKLVLVDSAGLGQECSSVLRLASVPGLGELLAALVMGGSLEKRISMQRESWPDPEIVPEEMIREKYFATRWHEISKTYFKSLRATFNIWGTKKSVFTPIVQKISSLENPVLVVWGEQDDMLPVNQAQIVREKVPGARIEIFENCKHDPMIVNPQRFNQVALEFLAE